MPNLLEGLLQRVGQGGLEAQGMASSASSDSGGMLSLQDILEQQLGGYYKGVDKAMKAMGEQQATEAIQAGVPATEVMQRLVKMVSPKGAFDPGGIEQGQQGEVTGIRRPGWVSRIGQAGLQVQGINAKSRPEEMLGQMSDLSKIQGQQQTKGVYGMSPTGEVKQYGQIPAGAELRSVYPEIGQPFGMEEFKEEIPEGMEITGYQVKYGKYLPTYKKKVSLVEKEKEIARLDIKRQVYQKDLDNFLMIDNILHQARGEGARRFGMGTKMSWEGLTRETPLGQAVGSHDAATKRLRVQLVRAAGDVGNINIVEQEAAEKLIPSRWDDFGTAEIKRAYLLELGRAINNFDSNAIQGVLKQAQVGFKFKKQTQDGWTPEKESRYQELLKKRGK